MLTYAILLNIIGGVSVSKNHKGQALVEFIFILPIIVLLLLGMVNVGVILMKKSELENKVVDILYVWQQQQASIKELETLFKKEGLEINISENTTTSFVTIKASEKISLISPIQKDYLLEVKRVIPFEQ